MNIEIQADRCQCRHWCFGCKKHWDGTIGRPDLHLCFKEKINHLFEKIIISNKSILTNE